MPRTSNALPLPARRLALPLVLLALLVPARAGELAELHAFLTMGAPDAPAAAGSPACDREPPPGTRFAPGVDPCAAPAAGAPRAVEVGLERTRCLTGCAAYTVRFSADGAVHYVGGEGAPRVGIHRGRIDPGLVRQVLRVADAVDPFALPRSFPGGGLDNPTAYVLVRTPERTTVIADTGGNAPPLIWALARLMDDLLEEVRWEE